jgi:hypothetical protein
MTSLYTRSHALGPWDFGHVKNLRIYFNLICGVSIFHIVLLWTGYMSWSGYTVHSVNLRIWSHLLFAKSCSLVVWIYLMDKRHQCMMLQAPLRQYVAENCSASLSAIYVAILSAIWVRVTSSDECVLLYDKQTVNTPLHGRSMSAICVVFRTLCCVHVYKARRCSLRSIFGVTC